jgi:hypothetical protein
MEISVEQSAEKITELYMHSQSSLSCEPALLLFLFVSEVLTMASKISFTLKSSCHQISSDSLLEYMILCVEWHSRACFVLECFYSIKL